jgi:acyl-CoA synthetase (AMP-forming)/AMP-acid ligase II
MMNQPVDTRTPTGPLATVLPMGDLLLSAARRWPDTVAISFPDKECTYRELAERAWHIALSLAGSGIRPGERVGILMPNTVETVAALFGTALAGAVIVPVNTRYRANELSHLISNAELAAIITTDVIDEHVDFAALLSAALPGLAAADAGGELRLPAAPTLRRVILLGSKRSPGTMSGTDFLARAKSADAVRVEASRRGVVIGDPVAIIYTSGTTAAPRGAMLTHENISRNWILTGERFDVRTGDKVWAPGPMFHMSAIGPLHFCLAVGATYLTDIRFDAGRALAHIQRARASHLYPIFPAISQGLVGHPDFPGTDLSSVRALASVAPPQTLAQLQALFPHARQVSTFGITEAGGCVSVHDVNEPERIRNFSTGSPLPGVRVRIIDPETGRRLADGLPGEIQVRGYNVFRGYFADPVQTAATLVDGGWLRTGDRGYLDLEAGLVYLGRIKEMLKVGGENVAPAEIEAQLMSHPAVQLVQVVGVPDERLGEVVAAVVELRVGQSATATELIESCRNRIASFKVPRHVLFVTSWPMSATKIQRFRVREQALAALGLTDDLAGVPSN